MKLVDRTGLRFHRLLVLRRGTGPRPDACYWLCRCDCGNEVSVVSAKLTNGHTKSCGCLRWEKLQAIATAKRTVPVEKHPEIIAAYQSGLNHRQVAERFGFRKLLTSYNIIKKSGIKRRSLAEARTTCKLNHFAFDEITDEVAYWVGFLITDGCLTASKSGSPVLKLSLGEKDAQHVHKFRRFMGSTHAIVAKPERRSSRLVKGRTVKGGAMVDWAAVIPRAMAQRLECLGVTPRKTRTAKACPELAMSPHFWRGCIDGDGTVSMHKCRGWRLCSISLVSGSPALARQWCEFVAATTGRAVKEPLFKHSLWFRHFSQKIARTVISALYPPGCVALDRKAEKAALILATKWGRWSNR